ncbi:histone-lysine N-methyltransferase SETMAR-like [Stegodyphus dumicola]|uniref:histone-lysine N-methyltransferase SETMAR-like n=1 Tax=Stegodyphus dumicola TaxID=202533 RepID=UPI0015ABDD89|nr:histone-lysine N-methyltransferase SETMAR-like [Stegodyphus dumicola]
MSLGKEILRCILLYMYKLGNKAAEALKRICSVLREISLSERTAQKWFSRFFSGKESLEDKPRISRPSTQCKVQLKKQIKQKPYQTCQELAPGDEVSDETIRSNLHNLDLKTKEGSC